MEKYLLARITGKSVDKRQWSYNESIGDDIRDVSYRLDIELLPDDEQLVDMTGYNIDTVRWATIEYRTMPDRNSGEPPRIFSELKTNDYVKILTIPNTRDEIIIEVPPPDFPFTAYGRHYYSSCIIRVEQLQPLLRCYPPGSAASQFISVVMEWNELIKREVNRVCKHALKLDGKQELEFFPIDEHGELITRLLDSNAEPSVWVVSNKQWVTNEICRVLGFSPKALDGSIEDIKLRARIIENDFLHYFTASYKEDGYASECLDVAIVTNDLIAYWISGIAGVTERGWTNHREIYALRTRFRRIMDKSL